MVSKKTSWNALSKCHSSLRSQREKITSLNNQEWLVVIMTTYELLVRSRWVSTDSIKSSSKAWFFNSQSSMTGSWGWYLHSAAANTPLPVSVIHDPFKKTGVLFKPQLGDRDVNIKPERWFSSAGFPRQYLFMTLVISIEGLSRPVSFGLSILPVSCTGGRGMERPASTSGHTGVSSKILLSFLRTMGLAFDLPS